MSDGATTSGPWAWEVDGCLYECIVDEETSEFKGLGKEILASRGDGNHTPVVLKAADKRLIQTAPQLYELLKVVTQVFEQEALEDEFCSMFKKLSTYIETGRMVQVEEVS